MNFLTEQLFKFVLSYYDQLPIHEGDNFFGTFGPGNLIYITDRPYERFEDYEFLLTELRERHPEKYKQIHKGTPFFFLSWLAFDLRNYEKALYYMDAAISEDVREYGKKWIGQPAALFLKLQEGNLKVGKRAIDQIKKILNDHLDRFNKLSGLKPIRIEEFVEKFVSPFIEEQSTRTIISAFYAFLMESSERMLELKLKSIQGSSIGPIITTLFSGGLIFESLLKCIYPKNDEGKASKQVGEIFKIKAFNNDFGSGMKTSADNLKEILEDINDDSLTTAFCTTAKLRNTTGHNLIWDNIFDDPSHYEKLSDQIVNAVLFFIEKQYIRKES